MPRHGKSGPEDARRGGNAHYDSDADCGTQHGVDSANAGNANLIDHPISFTAAPTKEEAEEEAFWPYGPTDEPVNTSGLFGPFDGVSGEETGGLHFMVEEEPAD